MSSPGAWTYLFGEQNVEFATDILACLELYLDAPVGVMPRQERPESLRASILGRVPPMEALP